MGCIVTVPISDNAGLKADLQPAENGIIPAPVDANVTLSPPLDAEALVLESMDAKKEENEDAHHTEKYNTENVVLRRGQKFAVDLNFEGREYMPARDKIIIEFAIGTDVTTATSASATKMRMEIGKQQKKKSKWGVVLVGVEKKKISVDVNIPSTAIIGMYKVTVEISSVCKNGVEVDRKEQPDVFVIFNPFCPDDDVYLEDKDQQNEYVLNDTGIVYYGTARRGRQKGMKWLFGQFEKDILSIALKLLREEPMSKTSPLKSLKKRSYPAQCVRILSAMINCGDDNGVLWGNWSGDYSGGARPTSWSGSVKILQSWNSSNMQPVKFGQCWVFSAVFTTVLRAIGIPARSVTNFNSAHDTEFNMTIDKFINEDGDDVDTGVGDSIWNFHVWNEAWFKRPDLPKGYDGWQACDATPQEESGGIMRCGPAPITAIKNGEIFIGQDTNFIFGEVNADRVYWRVDGNNEVTGLVKRQHRHVGKYISTKAVGSNKREDITRHYKYPEGSSKEREAFERAYAHGRKADYHDNFVIQDEGAINVTITPSPEDVTNGQSFHVDIKVENTTSEEKNATINTVICSLLNTDERKAILKRVKTKVSIPKHGENTEKIPLDFEEYGGSRLGDCNVIRFTTTVKVEETRNLYVERYDLELESPDCMDIEVPEKMKRYSYDTLRINVTNPLKVPLTGGTLTVEALGMETGDAIKINEPIPPDETVSFEMEDVYSWRLGTAQLIADFDCNEISNIKAYANVDVVR